MIEKDTSLSASARQRDHQLLDDHASEFDELRVADAEPGGDICTDYLLEFLQAFEEFRAQLEQGGRSLE